MTGGVAVRKMFGAVESTALGWMGASVAAFGWPGQVLASTEVCGCRAYPVVDWIADNLSARASAGIDPQLDRPTLALWEKAPCTSPPTPLRIVGFVSDEPWRRALHAVHGLRGLGAGGIVSTQGVSELELSEADFYGLSVATIGEAGVTLICRGRSGPVPTASRRVGTRFWEESLYQWAIGDGAARRALVPAAP